MSAGQTLAARVDPVAVLCGFRNALLRPVSRQHQRLTDPSQPRHHLLFRKFRYVFVPFHLDDGKDKIALFCVKLADCGQSSRRYVSLALTMGPRTMVYGGPAMI